MNLSVLGCLAAVLLGGVLGLFGAGGSILATPILVYLCGVPPVLATSYSLGVVGVTALLGAVGKARQGHVSGRAVVGFGVPSVIGVVLSRRVFLPITPERVWRLGEVTLTRDLVILVLFALLMTASGLAMARNSNSSDDEKTLETSNLNHARRSLVGPLLLALEGLIVGAVTGYVGVGGGFLIVPALALVVKLPIRRAVGTSLSIIALKSLIGFGSDYQLWASADWGLLIAFTASALLGMLLGGLLSERIDAKRLMRSFGWLIAAAGLLILIKEVSKLS